MIKERVALLLRLYKILDLLVVSISFVLAYFVSKSIRATLLPLLGNYLWLLIVILPIWGILFFSNQMYSSQRGKAFRIILWKVIKVNLEGLLCLGVFFFAFKIQYINRTLIFLFVLISIGLLTLEKAIILSILKHLRKKGRNVKNILIIGTGERARYFIKSIRPHSEIGIKLIGCLDIEPAKIGNSIEGTKIIGTSDQLSEILHSRVVDEVIFALPLSKSFLIQIKNYLLICQQMGINGRIVTGFYNYREFFDGRIFIDELLDTPLISFSTGPAKLAHLYIKSAFDFLVSLVALTILSPIMAIIAIAIKTTSPGPVIFKQERSGVHGRRFTLYKFRTMTEGAEVQQANLRNLNEMDGPVFKVSNDPRVTRLGKFLRKSSLDELPQLFNVLKGDMSLVGPRPLPIYETAHINGPDRRRLSVKPGITCTWQVAGRNEIDFKQWMKLDLEYVDNWSLGLDFKTILKTIPAVLVGKGAK